MKKLSFITLYFCIATLLLSCDTQMQIIHNKQLKYVTSVIIPHEQKFQGTQIGGLSGIDYDENTGLLYAISDDRGKIQPSRFYTIRIDWDEQNQPTVNFVGVDMIRNTEGNFFDNKKYKIDPESICKVDDGFLITTEGERLHEKSEKKRIAMDTKIYKTTPNGMIIDSLPTPESFKMLHPKQGINRNGGMESLDVDEVNNLIFTANEHPLIQDEPNLWTTIKKQVNNRLIIYNSENKKILHEYAYPLDNTFSKITPAMNGLTDILLLEGSEFLAIERAYSPLWKNGNKVRIYRCDYKNATDIKTQQSISNQKLTPITKDLLFDFATLDLPPDNIEGICIIPNKTKDKKYVLLVSDNNFSKKQKTLFWFLEVPTK